MSIMRVQDRVPEVYTAESRDFQMLCRLLDYSINGVKCDIDSITSIVDTDKCSSRLLRLLQTKLGFFSNAEFADDELRLILRAFPEIMKNKGSKKAIEQAVHVYLKLKHIQTDVDVKVINESLTTPYTVVISISSDVTDTYILDEIFHYILPAGYVYTYNFITKVGEEEVFNRDSTVRVVYIADNKNSRARSSDAGISSDTVAQNAIGSVNMTEVISSDAGSSTLEELKTYSD